MQFEGADAPYDGSVPIELALDPRRPVMLAYEMNGAPVPRDHGGPVRAIVPGSIGARSVKWVTSATASHEPAHSNWQRGFPYKAMSPNIKHFGGLNPDDLPSVYDLPVQSAMVSPKAEDMVTIKPREGTHGVIEVRGMTYDVAAVVVVVMVLGEVVVVVAAGDGAGGVVVCACATHVQLPHTHNFRWAASLRQQVEGYAWSGGGRNIVRVDVSADGGETWTTAELGKGSEQPYMQAWAWTLWKAEVPVPKSATPSGPVELVCKAVDRSMNVQPDTAEGIWNLRGILSTAWHRRIVNVVDES